MPSEQQDAGMKSTTTIRRKNFPFRDRIVLIPIKWITALKPMILLEEMLLLHRRR
jgi:hypothetical protein